MKHILLLVVMLTLAFGSPATPSETRAAAADSVLSANPENVEGAIIERHAGASLKPGYVFRRESRSSLAVLKTTNSAALQTGTLTCVRPGKGACSAEFINNKARCSSGCSFVGVRGGVLAR
jgi:hypothetical protein